MHSSIILGSLFAAFAIAAPAHQQLHKKAYVYDIVTEIVTVTVTAGQEPETIIISKTVFASPKIKAVETTKSSSNTTTSIKTTTTTTPSTTTTTTTTTTTPPPPPPTTTTTTTTTQPPPPPPTTTQAPVTTTQAPAPVVFAATVATTTAAAAPVVEAPQSSSGNGVKDAALNAHNAYRAKHHAGPLSWDDSLASSAASLASGCTNKHGLIVGGQNIAANGVSGSGDPVEFMTGAVDSWYNEVNQFGPYYGQSQVNDMSVLHFTQVVWKATTKLGCAVSDCGTGSSFFPGFRAYTIVCNYQSAGNFAGQYAENVAAP